MPKEQIDYLDERMTEFFQEIRDLRTAMHGEHGELRQDVADVIKRIVKLETQEKINRWLWTAGGAFGGFLIREVVGRLLG